VANVAQVTSQLASPYLSEILVGPIGFAQKGVEAFWQAEAHPSSAQVK
jgi:hypothetical protein